MSTVRAATDGLLLSGLDGCNPLAFLAALGTLRTLSIAWPERDVKMRWTEYGGAWRPAVLWSQGPTPGRTDIVATVFDVCCYGERESEREQARYHREQVLELQDQLETEEEQLRKRAFKKKDRVEQLRVLSTKLEEHQTQWLRITYPHLLLGPDTTVSPEEFRASESKAAASSTLLHRAYSDFVAALGTSVFEHDTGRIVDTALRTMSGAGHQHFLGFMINLLLKVSPHHLDKAMFTTWTYDDPVQNLTMRWDPIDDTRYALQSSDPSGDPARRNKGSVLGANALAIAGLPMIPSIPTESGLKTTGFSGRKATDTFWTWPIWHCAIGPKTCQSLLAHPTLVTLHHSSDRSSKYLELKARGVVECFRSRRITIGKIRSFTPAEAI